MNPWDTVAVALLLLFGLVLAGGIVMVMLATRWLRGRRSAVALGDGGTEASCETSSRPVPAPFVRRPGIWLAIRSRDTSAVQSALALNNPTSCSWSEVRESELFIAPPVGGWTLVLGAGLPDPSDDVDACFRFLLELSRKLGQVQFFQADRVFHHHAWARLEAGRVVRAYAWAGRTLWNQGPKTKAELEVAMKCFAYAETPGTTPWELSDCAALNADKVPLLAARWSLDPTAIGTRFLESTRGIAGEPTRFD